jgi:hypothetical protein
MASGYTPSWFYGMSQEFSISRNHPYTTAPLAHGSQSLGTAPIVMPRRSRLAEPPHIALAQQAQSPLKARPCQRRGTATSLHQHLDQLQDRELSIHGELGLLDVEADAVVCLRVGTHPDGAYRRRGACRSACGPSPGLYSCLSSRTGIPVEEPYRRASREKVVREYRAGVTALGPCVTTDRDNVGHPLHAVRRKT